jgi:hypothetical protein
MSMKTLRILECCFSSVLLLSACEKTNLSNRDQSEKTDTIEESSPDTIDMPGSTSDTTGVIPKNPEEGSGSDPSHHEGAQSFQTGDTVTVNQFLEDKINGGVYVYGYIVGCAYKKHVYLSPGDFMGKSSVLLASRSGEKDTKKMIAVSLKRKDMKRDLNLIDHPENYGKILMLFGYKETYLGFTGILDGSDYHLQ